MTLYGAAPLRAQEATLLNLENATASPYTLYTYTYTAVLSQTYITFQFRQDPSYYDLDDVSITPLGSSTALAINGDFEGSTTDMGGQLVPNGWTFVGQAGLDAGGTVAAGCGIASSACWRDGSVGGVDRLFQSFATTIGSQYTISFELNNKGDARRSARLHHSKPDGESSRQRLARKPRHTLAGACHGSGAGPLRARPVAARFARQLQRR
jgi:hypothetical protein